MDILIFAFILGSIGLVTYVLFTKSKDEVRLSPELKKEELYRENLARQSLKFSKPLAPLNKILLPFLGRGLDYRLSLADWNMLPVDFLAMKELIIAGLILGIFFVTNKIEPLFIGMAVLLGFVIPDIILQSRIQKRKLMIVKCLPDAIDLLSLCVEGGLDFMLGLNWVIKRSRPTPLIKEFSMLIHEIKIGRSRQDALKNMAKRLRMPEIFSFVNTLIHADRMGTPVAEVLHILADEARRQRFQRGERLALQAPIKMLFPLIFFILPVVAIIVGGPILLEFTKSGLPKF